MAALPDRITICLLIFLSLGGSVVGGAQAGPESSHARADSSRPAAVEGPYFYKGLPYGSEAYMGPLDVILNRGFAISQTDRHSRKIFAYPYAFAHVGDALTRPHEAVDRFGGWWQFVRKEMLPLSYKKDDVKWYTNYTGHIIEGGIHTRRIKEWYDAHGVPLSGLMAGATNMMAAVVNELYEHPGSKRGNAGTVADLYFFDLAGVLLFSWDPVARFFARTLHANVWPGQAAITFPAGELQNNAAYLVFKIPWKIVPNSSVFYWSGMGGQLGLTAHRAGGLDVSVAAGLDARTMNTDPDTGEETADLTTFSAGVFVDRNGSLLASLHVSQVEHRLLKLNIYPGVLHDSFGAWAVVTQDLGVRIGLSNRYWLGAGLGLGW